MRSGAPTLSDERGYTLVELLVAAFVLVVGMAGAFALLNGANRSSVTNNARMGATNLAREVLEDARSIDYDLLAPGALTSALQAKVGGSGTPWKISRRGIEYTLTADGTVTTGTIKLDSTKKPKQLEYTAENDDETSSTYVGVYELDGDTYRTCDVQKGKDERPTEFKTKAKTGQVAVWKKVKVRD